MKHYNPLYAQSLGLVFFVLGVILIKLSLRRLRSPGTKFRVCCGVMGIIAAIYLMTYGAFIFFLG